jgi:hypothetical protein
MKQNLLILILFEISLLLYNVNCRNDEKCLVDFKKFELNSLVIAGDYAKELGSPKDWSVIEPLGEMKFDQTGCFYYSTLTGLTPNKQYKYKVNLIQTLR